MEPLEDRRMLTTLYSMGEYGPTDGGGEGEAGGSAPYAPGQLLMRFTPGTSATRRAQILSQEGATILKTYQTVDVILVGLPPYQADVIGAAGRWTAKPEVLYAEPNYLVKSYQLMPDDVRFPEQWSLNNTGQSAGRADADIDAPEAWEIFTGTRDAVVAVIDTGVDYNHVDLAPNMWVNTGEIPGDGIDNDGNGYIDDVYGVNTLDNNGDPMDDDGHGTHVAGTIGAKGNNQIGVTGVNWDVQIMAVKFLGAAGGTTAGAIAGIDYVTMMKTRFGVNVVASNNSWGGGAFSQALYDAIQTHINADIVFVAAAGNDNNNNDLNPAYPASYDLAGIISVAATNHLDERSWYSNYGVTTVDLAAPGGALLGTAPQDILSTWPGNTYQAIAGTSMAAPHVAGVVALVRGLVPELSVAETKELILGGVDRLPALEGMVLTGGRLNAANTLGMLTPSFVTGTVWQDENFNRVRDAGERGVDNWTVYIDVNGNGRHDASEPFAVTRPDGTYSIQTYLRPGTYTVAQVLKPLWEQSFPVNGTHQITIAQRGATVSNINFGNRPVRGGVSGIKWNDLNGNGVRDPGEPGMPGVYIYADLDRNGSIALGEPAAITDAHGAYFIPGLPPGEVIIREVLNPGWEITYPAQGYHVVMIEPNATTPNVDFANTVAYDWGDAPLPYPTLAAHQGASHGLLPGFQLGALIDSERDGQPHPNALGDDLNRLDDEDGVKFTGPLFAGMTATIEVTVMNGRYPAGYLQGWIDFNRDGDWNDPGEQIIKDRLLGEGVHQITFTVPAGAAVGQSFARFRYGFEPGLGVTGHSRAGEVEDYAVLLLKDEPVAMPDSFEVEQDAISVPLDVLANDFPSSTGVLAVVNITQPARGQVSIAPGGQRVLYTPDRGAFSPPNDVFTYTISDGTGKTSTASVTVVIRPALLTPVAVDDAFYVAPLTSTNLPVLANDLTGILGTMQLVSVTTPSAGTATMHNNGTPADPLDDYIVYTPDGRFGDVDQFEYTIGNANGTSTAKVTIFRQPRLNDPAMEFFFDVVDSTGNPLTEVEVGDEFTLVVSVQDLRSGQVAPGVFAAYMDILFDRNLASPKFDANNDLGFAITFDSQYTNQKSGDSSLPGLLNEVGAFQASSLPPGASRLPVFRVVFTANAVGELTFTGDPADVRPDHDVLFYNPPTVVPLADIQYGLTSVSIVDPNFGSNSGGGGGTQLDVNGDGAISPIDALLVINYLNSKQLDPFAGDQTLTRLDVNRDGSVSPIDALLVINYLNSGRFGQGEGEGEGEGDWSLTAFNGRPGDTADLLSHGVLPLSTLNIAPLATPAPRVNARSVSAFFASAESRVDSDWDVRVGQAVAAPARVMAHRDGERPWESLLDLLAEDVLESWLDGDDA